MKKSKIAFYGLASAVFQTAYVLLIAFMMQNASKVLGQHDTFLSGPIALLVFVISAAISGSIVLGKPILLYAEGNKSDAIKLFACTLAWLAVFVLIFVVAVSFLN